MQAKDIQNEQGLSDELQAQGVFVVEVLRDGKNGPEVVQRRTTPNLVVNTGKRQIWRKATNLNTSLWKFMRIGTSGATPNSAQTNVIAPVTGTLRTVSDFSLLSGTRTFQWVVSYQSGAGTKSATNIREVVVMNQRTSPGGSALSRSTFTAVNKTTADKLRITYRARVT
jgi:hypothetical protein